ncbi:MAG TPA: hypothetical protein PKV06_07175 [bacterium]|nr:hypothetical protein [bacterium]
MSVLNVVWPAIYILKGIFAFWYVVVMTIFIEAFFLKKMIGISQKQSVIMSSVGNICSGVIGTAVMAFTMIPVTGYGPHFLSDLNSKANWILSFVVMFAGSALIEITVVRLIWKQSIGKTSAALLIGNAITYITIYFSIQF